MHPSNSKCTAQRVYKGSDLVLTGNATGLPIAVTCLPRDSVESHAGTAATVALSSTSPSARNRVTSGDSAPQGAQPVGLAEQVSPRWPTSHRAASRLELGSARPRE